MPRLAIDRREESAIVLVEKERRRRPFSPSHRSPAAAAPVRVFERMVAKFNHFSGQGEAQVYKHGYNEGMELVIQTADSYQYAQKGDLSALN